MSPAFSSLRQAAAFALLLLALLLAPVLIGKSGLPPREQSYAAMSWGIGPYPYLQHEIFGEQGDIDIAFVGSSHMLHGIDTPYVQAELSKKLGRTAVVRSLCWGGSGFDALYFVTQDLLEHRKVKLLVIYGDYLGLNMANPAAPCWFRWGENAAELSGLPSKLKGVYYFASILGMPRNLLSRVRPNIPAELVSSNKNLQELQYHCVNPALRLGSVASELGFNASLIFADYAPFVEYEPQTGARPEDVCIYSEATKARFSFARPTIPEWQRNFARKFGALAEAHHCRVVVLHLPQYPEMRSVTIPESEYWPETLGINLTLLGMPPATMFAGLSDEEVRRLFEDYGHMNKNGQKYFTALLVPALLRLYDTTAQP